MAEPGKSNLVLIGYRGSGKTTVGRAVAWRLGYAFVDIDERIVAEAGITIAEIFAKEGEAGFREREARVVREVMNGRRQVVAMGGGAVLRADNVECMRRGGFVVWLSAPVEVLWERIHRDAGSPANRPALTSSTGMDEVRQVLAAREPRYRIAAHVVIDASTDDIDQKAGAVVAAYTSTGASAP